jgi:hypothetical protein
MASLCCLGRIIGLVIALAIPLICAGQPAQPLSPSVIYDRSHSAVVVVIVVDKNSNPIGQGSGFIVDRNLVVTNHHVIEDAEGAVVFFADGSSGVVEGIAADSPARDLAILKVKTGTRSFLKLGDELALKPGDAVYAIGAPRGLELSITNGILSAFRDMEGKFVLQTTAAIAPGSSGGPLLDSKGRVVGVTTSLRTDAQGIYFSVGARDIVRMMRTPGIIVPLRSFAANVPAEKVEKRPEIPPATKSAIHVITDVIGATATLYGPAGREISNCTTPCSFTDLEPRRYSLQVQKDGYQSLQTTFELKKGDSLDQKLHLESLAMGLLVTSHPAGADIFINGAKQSGQTPLNLPLGPGQYDLVLRLAGYEAYSGHIQVKDNIQTSLNAELKEKSQNRVAWAQVTTVPAGAEIFIDGTSTGSFSPARVQMPSGTHVIVMRLDGYQVIRRGLQATEGSTVTISETLKVR